MRRNTRKMFTEEEVDAMLDQRRRFTLFMGCDDRAVRALYCEAAYATIPGVEPTDMDVEDFTRTILKARVDVGGQDPVVLLRWGI